MKKDPSKKTAYVVMIILGILGFGIDKIRGVIFGVIFGYIITVIVMAIQEYFKNQKSNLINRDIVIEDLFKNIKKPSPCILKTKNLSIKVDFYKKGERYIFDSDLYPYSKFDYSEKGQKWLKDLVINSQFSDGVKLESQTKRVFQISFAEDSKKGLRKTVETWLSLIELGVSEDSHLVEI